MRWKQTHLHTSLVGESTKTATLLHAWTFAAFLNQPSVHLNPSLKFPGFANINWMHVELGDSFLAKFGKILYPCSGPLPLKWKGPIFGNCRYADYKLFIFENQELSTFFPTPLDRPLPP